jgi:DNA-binding transcriptional MerR regulator
MLERQSHFTERETTMGKDLTAGGPYLRIDQVAARTGLTKRTLRYYEEIGLLAPPARTEGNYRLYSTADVARLERICELKEALGLTLAEINAMIQMEEERDDLRAAWRATHDSAARQAQLDRAEAITREQLDLVERKLRTLEASRATLRDRLARYETLRAEIQHHTDSKATAE